MIRCLARAVGRVFELVVVYPLERLALLLFAVGERVGDVPAGSERSTISQLRFALSYCVLLPLVILIGLLSFLDHPLFDAPDDKESYF